MKELIDENGGRITLGDLGTLLAVNADIVQTYVHKVCAEIDAEIVNGQIVTQAYIRDIVNEISSQILLLERVTIQELSEKYHLPIEYMRDLLAKWEKSLPKECSIQTNCIVTQSYDQR